MFYANLALVGVTVVLAGPSRLLLSRAMRVADFFAEQNSSEAGESGIVRFAAAGEVRGDRSSKAPL
jgi:hypothetical protein